MRYINFRDIRRQQWDVAAETNQNMPGLFEHLDAGISAIITVLYETSKQPDPVDDLGKVRSASWLWIYKSVFTMCASIQLAEMGFYTESHSLNRSITECLVQILYLAKHPEDIGKLPGIKSGRKLTFKKIFESIAPGFYEKYYRLNSTFTHPDWGSNALKMNRDETGRGFVDQGVVYKADGFTGTFNELVVLTLGFLRSTSILFSLSNLSQEVLHDLDSAIACMQVVLDSHMQFKGGPNEWHKLSEPLWNPR